MYNVEINGKKYFRIKRVIGHKADGSPVYKSFYGENKKDALRKYEEWQDAPADLMFDDMAQYYADEILSVSDYAQSTITLYTSSYNKYIKGKIRKPLTDLSAQDIQKLYNKLPITKAVMKSVHKFMVGLFKWLSQNDYCDNLIQNVIVPKKKDNKTSDSIILWSDDELKTIVTNLGNNRKRFFIICAVYTGMRLSELKGLKYSDFTDDFISIERQCYKGEIKPPKWKSVRSVPIHDRVREELSRHKTNHLKEMRDNNYSTDFVFTTDKGNLYDDGDLRRSLDRYYKSIGVPSKKLHAYRATFCTALCKKGVPIQIASKLLGHKSIEVTSRYYTSVSDQEKINALQKLTLF